MSRLEDKIEAARARAYAGRVFKPSITGPAPTVADHEAILAKIEDRQKDAVREALAAKYARQMAYKEDI